MRLLALLIFLLVFASCGDEVTTVETTEKIDTTLVLPVVQSGIAVDTTQSSIRISAIHDSKRNLIAVDVQFSSDSLRDTVNIYADSSLLSWMVDSIVNELCHGKDIRLIGQSNGQPIGIPFHWMNRFVRKSDSVDLPSDLYHVLSVRKNDIEFYPGDSLRNQHRKHEEMTGYFHQFYGNAFDPHDSIGFPEREPWRQTIEVLAMEGQSWDMVQMGIAPDTAAQLAAYNEFVNKLEIYDKVGEFNRLPIAFMDISYDPMTTWGEFLSVISLHHKAQSDLRNEAREYLADKIANEGLPQKEFTDEDLLLLYPDRLRWNEWMSGPAEHYYDAFHLHVHMIAPTGDEYD